MQKDDVFRLLVGSGYTIRSVVPKPNYHLFSVERTEILGTRIKTDIAVASTRFVRSDISWLTREAVRSGVALVLVGDFEGEASGTAILTPEQLMDRLGGPVMSLLPLSPEFPARLVELGHNRLPAGIVGEANDLFEAYVQAGLQYLFSARVVPYGDTRRFEKVADGLVIGDSSPLLLYDAKAYSDGYDVSADSIRQFKSYVDDFHRRYERRAGRLTAFVVASGKFKNGARSQEAKSRELRAQTGGIGLCFLRAEDMADIVSLMVEHPLHRRSLDWAQLLVRTQLTASDVRQQLEARLADKVIQD